jgi:hypothetical protein
MGSIANIAIDSRIPNLRFGCDVQACKGACCTLPGGRGAPLLPSELGELEKAFPVIRKYLSREHLDTIARFGLYERSAGEATTTCHENRACVFVSMESGIARCAFEKAFLSGEVAWRKPLSCHLFPIRVDRGLVERLRYEKIQECDPALPRGSRGHIRVSDFLKQALTRLYGEEWYDQFVRLCADERSIEE